MDDKELFTDEFNRFYDEHMGAGLPNAHKVDCYTSWIAAKRIQPSVVLPNNAEINHLAIDTAGEYDWNTIEAKEKYMKAFTDGALMICDDIARNITAAGIKYTVSK